jgi:hypothetical protein
VSEYCTPPRRFSIPIKTLANRGRTAKPGKLEDVGRHQKRLTEIEAELTQLKRELAEVKWKRDPLKKFATYEASPADRQRVMIHHSDRGSRGEFNRSSQRYCLTDLVVQISCERLS